MKRVHQIVLRCSRRRRFLFLALACAATIGVYAQTGALSSDQDKEDGISAGGKWMQFRSEDKITGAKRFRFERSSGTNFREEADYNPRIELFCSGGKLQQTYFNPGAELGPPNRHGFWGQPQMEVMVRIDDAHDQAWHHYKEPSRSFIRNVIAWKRKWSAWTRLYPHCPA